MDPKFCIVIPVYNHPQVSKLVDKLVAYQIPCILIDDGSDVPITSNNALVLRHENNLGKGAAVMTGLRHAAKNNYTHVVQIDADGQHNAEDVSKFILLSKQHPDAVIVGSPIYDKSVPKKRYYARYLTHIWVWINTLSFDIKDSMCGFRVYPLPAVMKLDKEVTLRKHMDFDSEILVRLHWDGLKIINLPTRVIYPKDNNSHFRLLKDNLLISSMHAKLFFGMVAQKKHWANMQEFTFITGMKFLLWIYKYFGRVVFQWMLYPVVSFYFLTKPSARRVSKNYLQRLNKKNSFRHFINFGESILDKLLLWSGLFKLDNIKIHGQEIIAQKRGGLFICSHLGNLELCRLMAKQIPDLKLTVLMHTKHAKAFNQLLAKLNPSSLLNIVQVTEITPATAIYLTEKVNRGEFVVIAGDRIPVSYSSRVVSAPFLGENALFPIGPYILGHLLQCPVYLIFSLNTELYFELFRENIKLPRQNRDKLLSRLAADYAKRLEYYCHKAPYQWFNFYDFWKPYANNSI